MILFAVLAALVVAKPAIAQELFVSCQGGIVRCNGTTGAIINTFAAGSVQHYGLAIGPDDHIYAADFSSNQVMRYNGITGVGMPSPGYPGAVYAAYEPGVGPTSPHDLAFGADGKLYLTSIGLINRVLRYLSNGLLETGFNGIVPTSYPRGLTFGGAQNDLYITSDHDIFRYDRLTGATVGAVPFATDPSAITHYDLAFGTGGDLFVTSFETSRVLRYNGTTGALVGTFVAAGAGGLDRPMGLAFGPDGNLYVASTGTNRILKFDGITGAFMSVFVSGNEIAGPRYLAFGRAPSTDPPSVGGCTDFAASTLDGWLAESILTSFWTPGPDGDADEYLRVADLGGASYVSAPNSYLGDWTGGGKCTRQFCYDVEIIDDGLGSSGNYSIGFRIYGPGGTLSAAFTPSVLMSEPSGSNSGWHTVCATAGPLVGTTMPSGWTMITGTTADWPALLANVAELRIGFDVGTTQEEVYGLDNLCLTEDCAGCDEECNLVLNGDFSAANSDFTSSIPFGCACAANSYCIVKTFQDKCPGWPAGADHTNDAAAYFLAIDGSLGSSTNVWHQQGLTTYAGTTYTFSFWGRNARPANEIVDLEFVVNGIALPSVANLTSGTWTLFTTTWTCTTGGATDVALRQKTGGMFRDFGIDDIFFGVCPCLCRPPLDCGLTLTAVPNLFGPVNIDYRRFTLTNGKSPASAISSVNVAFVNEPVPAHIGGGLAVDNVPIPWTYVGSSAYTMVDLTCGVDDAATTVALNLGVDETIDYTGIVEFTVTYCDGDVCAASYVWGPRIDADISTLVQSRAVAPDARIFRLGITPVDRTASISVTLPDSATILAGSSLDAWGSERVSISTRANTVVYTSTVGHGDSAVDLHVAYLLRRESSAPIDVVVRYFDTNGREIGRTVAKVAGAAFSDAGEGIAIVPIASDLALEIAPNPADSRSTVTLQLRKSGIVGIILTDLAGRVVGTISPNAPMQRGEHTFTVDTRDLVAGMYLVVARTDENHSISAQLKVIR